MGVAWPTRVGTVMSMLALACASTARAQASTRIDLDNDSFNFWQAPRVRADREYTQGTRARVLRPTENGLARRLLGGAPAGCGAAAQDQGCRMLSIGLTQSIYTPTLTALRRQPGERPYAGWLGAEIGVQRETDTGLRAFALGVGVTGKASMAEAAQKAVHRLFGFQQPQGWGSQLPSEVGVLASYTGARQILRLQDVRSGARLIVAPQWVLRAGTVATDATGGLQLTAGIHPPAPWPGAANHPADRWGLYGRLGVQQTLVGHNLFLDGTTFARSASVEKLRWVAERQAGIGIRTPAGMVEWQVHSLGREYRLQPKAHAYSTISFVLR